MSDYGSPFGCSQCGEARDKVYTCRDGGESVRVCPHDPEQRDCWWVKAGNPHTAQGNGCICLIDPKHWTSEQAA
jgi:hypothetical protein